MTKQLQGRIWTSAIHKNKSKTKITLSDVLQILEDNKGVCDIYAIEHDDTDQKHWHFVIIYKTPRKIKTVANVLNVEENMIQKVYNTRKIMRYLTHMDEPKGVKQYEATKVLTNSQKTYLKWVTGKEITDEELVNEIMKYGTGATISKYLGVIENNRLIQVTKLSEIIKRG